jgi:PAS domain S-box-containing protein
VWLVLALGAGVLLVSAGLYLREARQIESSLLATEGYRVGALAQVFQLELRPVADDLRELANGDGLRTYLATGRPADLDRAIQRAVFYSRLKPELDQVRYLDEHGRELVRVDHNGLIVPPSALQDKSGRPYFQKASALAPGMMYLSAFDLNVEHGQVERPLKPMLRFAVPVFDAAGRRRGVYVINVLGARLLSYMQDSRPDLQHRMRVLNARGYWLKGASPEQEWGFMFPERDGLTLARTAPVLWARLASEPQGQALHAGGVVTWKQVDLRKLVAGSADSVVAEDPLLVIASEISGEEFAALFRDLRILFGFSTALLLSAVIIGGRLLHARRVAQETLRESEARYRSLFNSIDEGFCIIEMIFDEQGKPVDYVFREVNESFERQTGLRDAVGKRMRELAPHLEEHWFQIYGRIALTGEPLRFQNRAEQLHRTYDVYASRFGNPQDLLVGILFNDITQRKQAEEELERFFTVSLDFLGIASADGYFKRVSSAITDMLGWTVEEFLARPFIDFVHPDDHAATLREVARQVEAGEPVMRFENRYQHKDGSWRVLSWRSVPQAGGLMYATARDVTELRRTEERILLLNADLAQRASQLEAANKELEAFSYTVSHDLRAPLRHVQGFVELLTREAEAQLSDKARRFLKTIADSAREMGELIDDLLAFSRMGRAEMREETVDLNQLIGQARAAFATVTEGRRIQWTVAALPAVKGDAAMLRQVLVNLLSNAVKYTRRRDPATIEVGRAGEEGGRIVLFVRDNGAGFDMQYASKLFGVFQRLHRAEEFEGTGIGLASVRRIIERHGGRVWAESQVEAGATFYFTLAPAASNPPINQSPLPAQVRPSSS